MSDVSRLTQVSGSALCDNAILCLLALFPNLLLSLLFLFILKLAFVAAADLYPEEVDAPDFQGGAANSNSVMKSLAMANQKLASRARRVAEVMTATATLMETPR